MLVALASIAGWSRNAYACSCAIPLDSFLAPEQGAMKVPTNTRLWLSSYVFGNTFSIEVDLNQLRLQTEVSGEVVAMTTGQIISGDLSHRPLLYVLTPTDPLSAETSYQLFHGDVEITQFTTGNSPDLEAPSTPVVTVADVTSEAADKHSSCSEANYIVSYSVDHEGLLALVVEAGKMTELEQDTLSGTIVTATSNDMLWVGSGNCVYNWPEAKPGAELPVQFAAVDLAGNVSKWSESQSTPIPSDCACQLDQPMANAGWFWGVFGWLLISGIRRRPLTK